MLVALDNRAEVLLHKDEGTIVINTVEFEFEVVVADGAQYGVGLAFHLRVDGPFDTADLPGAKPFGISHGLAGIFLGVLQAGVLAAYVTFLGQTDGEYHEVAEALGIRIEGPGFDNIRSRSWSCFWSTIR